MVREQLNTPVNTGRIQWAEARFFGIDIEGLFSEPVAEGLVLLGMVEVAETVDYDTARHYAQRYEKST